MGRFGSAVLLLVGAALILRPWERPPDPGPAVARAYVVRAVDGDTVEVRLGDRREDVRYKRMTARPALTRLLEAWLISSPGHSHDLTEILS